MRPIPDAAIALVKQSEGCRLTAYQDAVGVWTIGYGHVSDVKPGQKISETKAAQFLRMDLQDAAARLQGVLGVSLEDLTDNQYAALLSFVFNLGCDPKWTIWKRIKAKKYELVPGQLNRFIYADGKRLQGLANRRAAETALWRQGEPGTEDKQLSSGATRLMDTTPVATDAAPRKSATLWGAVCALFASAYTFLRDQISQAPDLIKSTLAQILPFTEHSTIAQTIANWLAGAGVVAMVLVTFNVFKTKREGQR